MPRICLRCGAAEPEPVLRYLRLCNSCAFVMQSQAIDEALATGVMAFDHNDASDGHAVYASLIYQPLDAAG